MRNKRNLFKKIGKTLLKLYCVASSICFSLVMILGFFLDLKEQVEYPSFQKQSW